MAEDSIRSSPARAASSRSVALRKFPLHRMKSPRWTSITIVGISGAPREHAPRLGLLQLEIAVSIVAFTRTHLALTSPPFWNILSGFKGTTAPGPASMRWIATAALLAFLIQPSKSGAGPGNQDTSAAASSVHLTAEQDHQQMIDLLHITSLLRGADGDAQFRRCTMSRLAEHLT